MGFSSVKPKNPSQTWVKWVFAQPWIQMRTHLLRSIPTKPTTGQTTDPEPSLGATVNKRVSICIHQQHKTNFICVICDPVPGSSTAFASSLFTHSTTSPLPGTSSTSESCRESRRVDLQSRVRLQVLQYLSPVFKVQVLRVDYRTLNTEH